MFVVIGIMFCGIAAGYFLRRSAILKHIGKPVGYTIVLLLFLLGIQVGSNRQIISNLPSLGGQAFVLAFAGIIGSVLAAWVVHRLFLSKGGDRP